MQLGISKKVTLILSVLLMGGSDTLFGSELSAGQERYFEANECQPD